MRFFVLIVLLALPALPAVALDPEVSVELERIAKDPTTDPTGLAVNLQNHVFLTVWEKLPVSAADRTRALQ